MTIRQRRMTERRGVSVGVGRSARFEDGLERELAWHARDAIYGLRLRLLGLALPLLEDVPAASASAIATRARPGILTLRLEAAPEPAVLLEQEIDATAILAAIRRGARRGCLDLIHLPLLSCTRSCREHDTPRAL